jgi:CRISPR/Cas system-associated protein endoribonuclease Cas2
MIWVDLDNTLVWTWQPLIPTPQIAALFGLPIDTPPTGRAHYKLRRVIIGDGYALSCARKHALPFLRALRGLGEVRMLTLATRQYAEAMSSAFGLGFTPESTVAREDYQAAVRGEAPTRIDPAGVLVENIPYPGGYENERDHREKLALLGIERSRVVFVQPFVGEKRETFPRRWRKHIADVKAVLP